MTLKDDSGKVTEATSIKTGFRTSEVKNGQYLVNGKPVLLKGVNLHEFNQLTGQVVTEADVRLDMERMKQLNVNAIRLSHYPQPAFFYDLADQYEIGRASCRERVEVSVRGGWRTRSVRRGDGDWRCTLRLVPAAAAGPAGP